MISQRYEFNATSDKLIAEGRAVPLKLVVRRIKALRVERRMAKQEMSGEQVFVSMVESETQRQKDPTGQVVMMR